MIPFPANMLLCKNKSDKGNMNIEYGDYYLFLYYLLAWWQNLFCAMFNMKKMVILFLIMLVYLYMAHCSVETLGLVWKYYSYITPVSYLSPNIDWA